MINDPIYSIPEAAQLLGVTESFLRAQLRSRQIAGYKPAGKWLMRESQIVAAMNDMSTEVRVPAVSPAGLAPGSRFRRRVHAKVAS